MTRQKIDDRQRRWLQGELPNWVADQLISVDQQNKILTWYETDEEAEHRNKSLVVFALQAMAAFLFGLAVLLLIGFNWQEIPRFGKLIICLTAVGITHGIGFFLRSRGQSRLSEVVFFLGCLLYGSGIWLVAQAYHIQAHYPDGVWWWAVGVLPFALCLESLLLHLLFVALMALWLGMEVFGGLRFGPWGFYGFWTHLPGILSLPLLAFPGLIWGYRKASPRAVGLYVPLFVWWVILEAVSFGVGPRAIFWVGSIGAILLLLAELHGTGNAMAIPYRLWGVVLIVGVMFPLSSHHFWEYGIVGHLGSPYYSTANVIVTSLMEFTTIAGFPALGVALWLFARRGTEQHGKLWNLPYQQWYPLVLVVIMGGIALLSLSESVRLFSWLILVIFNLVMLGLALYLIRVGAKEERTQPFAAGVAYFLVWAFARYIDLFAMSGGMLGAAVLFALCAVGLIVVAKFWSRAKAAKHDHTAVSHAPVPYAGPAWLDRSAAYLSLKVYPIMILTMVFQIVLLVSMIILNAAPLYLGETVKLRLQPVDPRDLFRGDYVILNYEINRIQDWSRFQHGQTVYMKLESDGDFYKGAGLSDSPPATGKYIRGRIEYGRVVYGIESYFVQEGEGRKWEDLRNRQKLSAEVALSPWGQGKLKRLVAE